MAGGAGEAVALAEYLQAPVVTSYLHNDAFPKRHPLMCGPLGYQGSKAAMKIIAQADVVLALGTPPRPFGTLPQHGIEYWPKDAKIIQVDTDHRMLGLVKQMHRRRAWRRRQGGGARSCTGCRPATAARGARQQGRAPRRSAEAEAGLGERARRLVDEGRLADRAAPRAARAREGHAEERHGHHRHRQRLLGRQQLPALRAAAELLRGR